MPSPFPGMDPYLEGYLWPDVHRSLAVKIRQLLVPQLRPKYAARLEISVVEDGTPEAEIGVMYPDVEVLLHRPEATLIEPSSLETATPAVLAVPVFAPVELELVSVEIRDTSSNLLVTTIEILSPVNKREPHLTRYRQKRHRLHQAGVHLVELDLLRRGTRPLAHPSIPDVPYLISLTRAAEAVSLLWPLTLRDSLPKLGIPLRPEDDDVLLDLPIVLNQIYDEAAYDITIDYDQLPPPPPLSQDDLAWLRSVIAQHQA